MNDSASKPEVAPGPVPSPHWQQTPLAAPTGRVATSESPLLIRLPDLNAANKPNFKLVGLPDEVESAPAPPKPKSVLRIDQPARGGQNKTAAAAAAGLSATSQWAAFGK